MSQNKAVGAVVAVTGIAALVGVVIYIASKNKASAQRPLRPLGQGGGQGAQGGGQGGQGGGKRNGTPCITNGKAGVIMNGVCKPSSATQPKPKPKAGGGSGGGRPGSGSGSGGTRPPASSDQYQYGAYSEYGNQYTGYDGESLPYDGYPDYGDYPDYGGYDYPDYGGGGGYSPNYGGGYDYNDYGGGGGGNYDEYSYIY